MAVTANVGLLANRARGEVKLAVGSVAGITRRRRVHENGSLRVRFPGAPADELEAVLLNTAGGMTGGDQFDIDISVGEHARLLITTAAAEKIYRSLGPCSTVNIKIDVKSGATVSWLPQETILFDRAHLRRRIEVDLAEDASLVLLESLVMGRAGMGEVVNAGGLLDSWRVRRNGRLIYAEGNCLGGDISRHLAETAVANGGNAVATALVVPGDDALVQAVRALGSAYCGEVGASAWNGQAAIRFCARDGAALRHDTTCTLRTLRAAPLPRLWAG